MLGCGGEPGERADETSGDEPPDEGGTRRDEKADADEAHCQRRQHLRLSARVGEHDPHPISVDRTGDGPVRRPIAASGEEDGIAGSSGLKHIVCHRHGGFAKQQADVTVGLVHLQPDLLLHAQEARQPQALALETSRPAGSLTGRSRLKRVGVGRDLPGGPGYLQQ